MLISKTSTPVVLLRAVRQGGLCITRSLGKLGIPVYAVDPDPWCPTAFSRYCRGRFRWDVGTSPAGESVNFLLEVAAKTGGRPILIPTTDAAALFVADHSDELRGSYAFPDQNKETVHGLSDKASMFRLAKSYGIPTPDTFFPQSRADVLAFLETATLPIMLKALDYVRQRKRGTEGKQIATSRSEVLEKYDRMQDPDEPNLVLQEYIPGGDDTIWMFNGYFDSDSECLFGVTGKKLRQCPVYTGSTCLGICLRNDDVLKSTLRLMKSVGYRGILDIGYRYDARDGQYKLLDVNPRIGSTFRLFAGDGDLDVARALYLDLTGQKVPYSAPRYGRKWIVEDWDLVSSFRYFRDRKLTVKDWLKSFRGVEETSFLSLRDPLPVAAVVLSDLAQFGTKLGNSDKAAWRPAPEEHKQPVANGSHAVSPNALFNGSAQYWKDVYNKDEDLFSAIYQERRAATLSLVDELGLAPESRVLEVGCGAGLMAVEIAKRGYEVAAIDFSKSMIETAKTVAANEGIDGQVKTSLADVHSLPFPDDYFQILLAIGLLPWLRSLEWPLHEMIRVLEPGGYLIVSADNLWRLNLWLDPYARVRSLLGNGTRHATPRLHSPRKVDQQLQAAGLDKLEGRTVGFGPFTLFGHKLLSDPAARKLHCKLQRLADDGMPLLRTLGSQYLVLAAKPKLRYSSVKSRSSAKCA